MNGKLNNNIRLENNEKNQEKEEEKENSHYKNKSTINSQKKILEVGTKKKKELEIQEIKRVNTQKYKHAKPVIDEKK